MTEKKWQETLDAYDKNYKKECENADWHNNNTPNVGISIQYENKPKYSPLAKALKECMEMLARWKESSAAHSERIRKGYDPNM